MAMIKNLLVAGSVLMAGSASAVVVVDGAAGQDADGMSPFETLQAAVSFANGSSETVIEIHTSDLPAGVDFSGVALNHNLTIQAGASFSPVIRGALQFIPTNQEHLVTLQDLSVITNPTNENTTVPLSVGCNVTAVNCVFDSNHALATSAAVSCAVPSAGTISTLTLTSCTLSGYTALETGRSCLNHVLTNCVLIAIPQAGTTSPFNSVGLTNSRNFRTRGSAVPSEPRMDETAGFTVIQQPRNVTMTNVTIRAGMPICWPSTKDPLKWNENEHNVFGRINATNCVFESLRSDTTTGFPSSIGQANLPTDQDIVCKFTHCTFFAKAYYAPGSTTPAKSVNGLLYFLAGSHPEVAFYNCLFDSLASDYIIFDHITATGGSPNAILTGDGNTYHFRGGNQQNRAIITTGSPYQAGAVFEATQSNYVQTADDMGLPLFVDDDGNIAQNDASVVNRAVVLSPPLTTDKDGDPRPMPAGASFPDVGADETDESQAAAVPEWELF